MHADHSKVQKSRNPLLDGEEARTDETTNHSEYEQAHKYHLDEEAGHDVL